MAGTSNLEPRYGSAESLNALVWPAASLILILLGIASAASVLGIDLVEVAVVEMLVKVIVVVGLYIFIGNSGVVSFGHIVFMLLGAYCAAWLTLPVPLKRMNLPGLPSFLAGHQYDVFLAALVSGGLASAFACVIGIPLMGISGLAASMAMFCVLAVLHMVYANWDAVTLGLSSIVGLPTYVNVWVAFGWAAVTIVVAYVYQVSRFGLALRATREDELAAVASGIHVTAQRMGAFVLSGFFVGVGGALYGHYLGAVSVDTYYIGMTFVTLAMLVVGGMRSLSGAVVGVLVISALVESLRKLESGIDLGRFVVAAPTYSQELGLAIVMILILLFRPKGLMGGAELQWPPAIYTRLRFRFTKGENR